MKSTAFTVFRILVGIVLIAKILDWFLHFSNETNRALNITMFSLIGIAYLVMAYVWDNKFIKLVITICGLFLIAVNFLGNNTALDIIGIVCILTPGLIARFQKDNSGTLNSSGAE